MTNEEIYDFIGELAIALYSKKIQISLGALRAIMLDKGKDYVNNRGMASAVSGMTERSEERLAAARLFLHLIWRFYESR